METNAKDFEITGYLKILSVGYLRPANPVSTYQCIAQRAAHVPVCPLCQVLRVAPAACYV